MSSLGRAVIEFSADTAKFTGDVGRAAAVFERNMRGMTNAAQSMLQVIGVGVGVGAMVALARNTLNAGDELYKMSQKTGIAVEDLSTLKYAAELSDVSMEALGKGVKKLSTTMVEATDATSKSGKLMKTLGIDATTATLPALEKLADIFAILPDGPTKAALAVEVFGRAGMDMIPFLSQGAAGIRKLRDEGEALGLKMSTETAKAAEQFNDNMKAVGRASTGAAQAILAEATPSLVRIGEAMKAAAIESGILSAAWVALGGVAAEALGLNDSELKKIKNRLKEVTEQASKFGAVLSEKRRAELLENAGLAANAVEYQFIRAIAAINHFKNLTSAINGEFSDQNDRRAMKRPNLGAASASEAERKAMEDKIRASLSHNEGAEKKAAAQKLKYEGVAQGLTKTLMGLNHESQVTLFTYELEKGTLQDLQKLYGPRILALAAEVDKKRNSIEMSKQAVAAWEAEVVGMEKSTEAIRNMEVEQGAINREQLEQMEFELSLIGKTTREQEVLNAVRAIDLDLRKQIAALPHDDSAQTSEAQIRMMEKAEEQKKRVLAGLRERQEAEREWSFGAKKAFQEYSESAMNAAANSQRFFSNAFQTMEDALVEFVQTGKLDFKKLADSIIADLIRIEIKSKILGPISKSMEGGTSLWGSVMKLFGGGASSGGGAAASSGGDWIQGMFGMEGFASGTPYVKHDGPAYLHKGEAVITAADNARGMQGSDAGPSFFVDMRGASVEAVRRLEAFVNQINGSLESRAVTAVFSERQRGNKG